MSECWVQLTCYNYYNSLSFIYVYTSVWVSAEFNLRVTTTTTLWVLYTCIRRYEWVLSSTYVLQLLQLFEFYIRVYVGMSECWVQLTCYNYYNSLSFIYVYTSVEVSVEFNLPVTTTTTLWVLYTCIRRYEWVLSSSHLLQMTATTTRRRPRNSNDATVLVMTTESKGKRIWLQILYTISN